MLDWILSAMTVWKKFRLCCVTHTNSSKMVDHSMFIPANDTFPIEIDYCWFTRIITQCRALRLCPMTTFGISCWNALQIVHKFCRLIAYKKIIIRKSNKIYSKWQPNQPANQAILSSAQTHTRTRRYYKKMVLIGQWRNGASFCLFGLLACAFSMSLINTV